MHHTHRKIHYAWIILIGCCLLQGATLGIIFNCAGIFITPVTTALNAPISHFTITRTISGLTMCLITPFVVKIYEKYNFKVVMLFAALLYGGLQISMAFFTQLWQWYLSTLIQGLAGAFLAFLPAPLIINNWFHKKAGIAISLSAAFSGITAMIMSLVLGKVMESWDWRVAYAVNGFSCLAFALPAIIFILRYRPSDMGMLPYGFSEGTSSQGVSVTSIQIGKTPFSIYLKNPAFILILVLLPPIHYVTTFYSYINSLGATMGMSVFAAAALTTFSSAGNLAIKTLLGPIADRFGSKATAYVNISFVLVGTLLMLANLTSLIGIAAFCFGTVLPFLTVALPLIVRDIWKGDEYSRIYPLITAISSLVSSIFAPIVGAIYDAYLSYTPVMIVCLIALVFCFPIIHFIFRAGKKAVLANS